MATLLLASVTDVAEARAARAAGAHVIDLKDPARGALGALPTAVCAAVARALDAGVLVSAALGDDPGAFREGSHRMAAAGVRLVKLGARLDSPVCIATLKSLLPELQAAGTRAVVTWLAESGLPDAGLLRALAAAGAWGTMLDTADKAGGPLPTRVPGARLRDFVHAARSAGLRVGLAGGLRAPDVPALIELAPDYLGFRGALCANGRSGRLQAAKVRHLVACCARSAPGHAPVL